MLSTNTISVPQGTFGAKGEQTIPSSYVSQIPSIAFTIPDLDGMARMILKGKDGKEVACIESSVTNGKTVEVPAVQGVAVIIAASALVFSAASAAMAGNQPGASHSSPGFMETMWWMQTMATDGMLSVDYPGIYRSYTKNFAFSTGLVSWEGMQHAIEGFRSTTGGNLTHNNYDYLKNATLRFPDGSTATTTHQFKRFAVRALDVLLPRQDGISTSVNGTGSMGNTTSHGQQSLLVSGIQAYVEQYTIPDSNAFMTVLLCFTIVLAAVIVGILLFKVILEAWSLMGKFPNRLSTFRKEYWRVMAQTITNLVFLLYGMWVLYCIFQFKRGDSWAVKLLAGITLALFSALLGFYIWKILYVARKLKSTSGDSSGLYQDKPTWKKYRIFYENFKSAYWWMFVPWILYMLAKGCIIAGADGYGKVQAIGQLAVEAAMLVLLLWNRPYGRKSGNWINIIISVVRVLSVCCILVVAFVIGKTTHAIMGIILVVMQASLTAVLAILIFINAIINCVKENPHRKKRKAAEKAVSRDMEGDAFLMEVRGKDGQPEIAAPGYAYDDMRAQAQANRASRYGMNRTQSQDPLIRGHSQASIGKKGPYVSVAQDVTPEVTPVHSYSDREPRLPDVGFDQRGGQYGRQY